MLGFLCLFYFLIYGFTNQTFNLLLGTITADMGWTDVQRTAMASAMPSGMLWFVFVAGTLLDKFSAKKILGSAIVLSGLLTILRGQAHGFSLFFTIIFLFGVASAFFLPACVKILSLWFDQDELMFTNGCLFASISIGMIVANLFTAQIIAVLGSWRIMYIFTGIGSVLIAAAFFIFGKERKNEDASLKSSILTAADLGFWKNIKGIMKVPFVWFYTMANMFFLSTLFAANALGQYIYQSDWGLSITASGRVHAFSNIATMSAFVFVPLIIGKMGRKHFMKIIIICGIFVPVLKIAGHLSYNYIFLCATMFLSGILGGAAMPAPRVLLLQLPEVSGPRAGTAMGFYQTIERIGIAGITAVLGTLISLNGTLRTGEILGLVFLLQFFSPFFLILSVFLIRKTRAKADAAQQVQQK